jgi:hypothetical protein
MGKKFIVSESVWFTYTRTQAGAKADSALIWNLILRFTGNGSEPKENASEPHRSHKPEKLHYHFRVCVFIGPVGSKKAYINCAAQPINYGSDQKNFPDDSAPACESILIFHFIFFPFASFTSDTIACHCQTKIERYPKPESGIDQGRGRPVSRLLCNKKLKQC